MKLPNKLVTSLVLGAVILVTVAFSWPQPGLAPAAPSQGQVLSQAITQTNSPELTNTAVVTDDGPRINRRQSLAQTTPAANNLPASTPQAVIPADQPSLVAQDPAPVACTNSWPEQSCTYPELPAESESTQPGLIAQDPAPVACTNSWPEQSCTY